MIPTSMTDVELIKLVRDHNDNQAFTELATRHTGIYLSIVSKYSGFSDKIQMAELKDDKSYNIYKWILSYNEDRGMKFGTYVGEMTKYTCLNTMNETPDKVAIEEANEPVADEVPRAIDDTVTDLERRARQVPNSKFWPIFKARHLGEKPETWRNIGHDLGITHEWARQIYKMYISWMREEIKR